MAKSRIKHKTASRGDNRTRRGVFRTLKQRLGDRKRRKK